MRCEIFCYESAYSESVTEFQERINSWLSFLEKTEQEVFQLTHSESQAKNAIDKLVFSMTVVVWSRPKQTPPNPRVKRTGARTARKSPSA